MGTRSGDLDPAIIEFIAAKEWLSTREVETLMNKQSGLLGISGLTSDMRELLAEAREENDRRFRLVRSTVGGATLSNVRVDRARRSHSRRNN